MIFHRIFPLKKNSNTIIDLNGHKLTGNYSINQYNAGTITIKGNGDITCIRVYNDSATIILDDSFTGKLNSIIYSKGTLTFKGGYVASSIFSGTYANLYRTRYIAEGYGDFESNIDGYVKIEQITASNAPISCTIDSTTSYYMMLKDASNAAVDGGVIRLLKDYTLSTGSFNANYSPTANVTLDLNGHTLNMGKYANFMNIYSGTLTVTDSIGTGTIIANNSGSNPFKVYASANFVAKDIVCDSTNIILLSCDTNAIGNITLTNVTVTKGIVTRGTAIFDNCNITNEVTVFNAHLQLIAETMELFAHMREQRLL